MARKKSAAETIQAEPGTKSKQRMKSVTGKHTIIYEAPVNVPVVEPEDEPGEDVIEEVELEEGEETEEQPEHREPPVHIRLRQRFKRRGITGEATLQLRIDRMPNFERDGLAGVRVDKEFCGVIVVTEKFFDNDNHLIEIQRRYGPGTYWLTVRYKSTIVDSWRECIGGFQAVASPAPVTSEAGAVNPQVIFQSAPNQPQQPIAVQDPLAQMRQAFKLVRELREDLGLMMPQQTSEPASPPPTDPKIAALSLIAENPDVMEKIGSGIAKTVLGSRGEKESDPWADVAMEAIKSGQAPHIVATLIREFMAPFRNLWGGNNGQTQMDQAPLQNQTHPAHQQQGRTAIGQEAGQVAASGDGAGDVGGDVHRGSNAQMGALTPEAVQRLVTQTPLRVSDAIDLVAQGYISADDLALMKVIANCQRQIDPQKTYNWLMEFANTINDEIPDYSIYDRIDLLGAATVNEALDYVKQLPGGEHVTSLPHAKSWTEHLQRLIQENQQEEDDE